MSDTTAGVAEELARDAFAAWQRWVRDTPDGATAPNWVAVADNAHGICERAFTQGFIEAALRAQASAPDPETTKCPLCFRNGWVLDCNDLTKAGPRMFEFIPCFYPTCPDSGRLVFSVAFKGGAKFRNVARHPSEQYVTSLS